MVVVFDEFSSISRIDDAAGLLRAKLQHHFQTIGLLFAGFDGSPPNRTRRPVAVGAVTHPGDDRSEP